MFHCFNEGKVERVRKTHFLFKNESTMVQLWMVTVKGRNWFFLVNSYVFRNPSVGINQSKGIVIDKRQKLKIISVSD